MHISKAITLKGQGYGNTNTTVTSAGAVSVETSGVRITGFRFQSNSMFGGKSGQGMLHVNSGTGWRIDHNQFYIRSQPADLWSQGFGMSVYGSTNEGLIDHNIFTDHPSSTSCWQAGVYITANNKAEYYEPSHLGTAEMVYIDDNIFENTWRHDGTGYNCTEPHAVFGARGAWFAARHNEIRAANIDAHGFEVAASTREYEISNNKWILGSSCKNGTGGTEPCRVYRAIYLRGGTGVIYNNSKSGSGYVSYAVGMTIPRVTNRRGNYNRSELYGGVNSNSCCSSTEGSPCVDGIGRGQATGTSPNMTQVLDPLYLWNNSSLGPISVMDYGSVNTACSGSTNNYVQSGKDYYSDNSSPYAQKPGYAPYSYPHPLAGGEPVGDLEALNPPDNIRINWIN
jgi:hypothetical protein